jgi:hypothetical protein
VPDRIDQVFIDDSFGQSIDADYPNRERKLSLKFGIKVIDEIVDDIIHSADPAFFRLFSVIRGMSGSAARDASIYLKRIEKMMQKDGHPHDASMVFDDVALTFIVANDPAKARSRFDALRQKRDFEQKYAQEYILVLSPRNRASGTKAGSHFVIRAIAMKQNRASDAGILAFSPRIRSEDWEVNAGT